MCAVTCSCPSPSESKIGETNKRTKLHRHGKVNKETSNTPHAVTSRRSRAEERINVTLGWQAVYIKSHSFHLGTAGKCCKLAQCWTSSTCLRLGFVWFGEEKGNKKKRERERDFHIWQFQHNTLLPMTCDQGLVWFDICPQHRATSEANLLP